MTDLVVRLVIVAATLAVAGGLAYVAHRRTARRMEVAPVDLSGFGGRVLFFSDAACRRCPVVRDLLDELGVDYAEFSYGEHPEGMRAAGITAVPLVVVRDEAGGEVGRIAGRPGVRRLRRLLRAGQVSYERGPAASA